MRNAKRNRVLLAFLAGIVFILFSGCGVNEYKFTTWNGSFIINDSTLGLISWKYDKDESSNIFITSGYANFRQYFYTYNLNKIAIYPLNYKLKVVYYV